jgi:signal transduction histidine kinase/ligand-binding sensor domain-containing protein/DNA-binding response OmpR family regulator
MKLSRLVMSILFLIGTQFFTSFSLSAQEQQYSIDYLTIDAGLPQNEVTSIIQDRLGFLWFGTRGGLARYDGHNIRVFQYDPRSSNSLSNNSIETLFEDRKGNIWIGTKSGGLNRFDPHSESFRIYQSDPSDPTTLSGNRVVSIEEDITGNIWIGTWKTGLNRLDLSTGKFTRYLPGKSILSMKAAKDGTLWISADFELYNVIPRNQELRVVTALDPSSDITSLVIDEKMNSVWFGGWNTGLLMHHLEDAAKNKIMLHDPENKNSISGFNIYSLLIDDRDLLWTGFWGAGLNVIDRKGNVKHFALTGPSGQSSTDYNIILSIFQDRSGTIWVGTDGGGVCKLQETKTFFDTYSPGNSSLSNGHILSLMEDSDKTIWIGTKAGGVNTLSNGRITQHPEILQQTGNRDVNIVYTFHQDRNKTIWFGTSMGLHKVVKFENNKINSVLVRVAPSESVPRKVTAVLTDSRGRLWAGTQQHGLYRSRENISTSMTFKNYEASKASHHGLFENRVSYLFEDSKKRMWVGTYQGLYVYDDAQDRFTGIYHRHGDAKSLSNDIINCINEDASGNLWVGTPGGLNRVTYENGKLAAHYFTKKDGLPNDYINAILFDEEEHLWISSNAGLFEFNPKNHLIKIFTRQDGLQSNAFSEAAACKDMNGTMYFGGINGVNAFDPSAVPPPVPSPLVFVSLKIMNQPVNPRDTVNDRVILKNSITYSDEITLGHMDRVVSIEVSSIDFTFSEKNQYSFKLSGFDDNWVNSGSSKAITYTNLKPGNYTLSVRASDVGNVWNDQVIHLSIRVLAAPWLTWWAYLAYAVILVSIAAFVWHDIKKQIKLKNELHAAQVIHARTQLEQHKEKEISEMKLRFFTNVSHELRTPLTLISSPLEELLSSSAIPLPIREKLALMNRHTNKLLSLVSQLLDFRKTESGNMQLFIEQTDVVRYVTGIFESFKHLAARRNITYSFHSDLDHLLIEIDKNKIEIAVTNIISNAFKYSSDGSEINCQISIEKDTDDHKIYCLIQVKDAGRGMPPEVLRKIFDLYYQVSVSESMRVSGSGIGLSLVKEVVQAHRGEVTVTSKVGEGSLFTIKLPVKQSPRLSIVSVSRDATFRDSVDDSQLLNENIAESYQEAEKPVLLVIEDTEELRNYLTQLLSAKYLVLGAATAEAGLKIAFQRIPDVIVSDVMLPEMDGFALCQQIKTNEKTSHIPVILLTAKIMPENELLGLKNGADDYIKKPFIPSILHARIGRQLEARKHLKEYYSRKVTLQPTNIEITSYDEKFLKKAMAFIEDNLLNSEFNNESLEKELGMSHSTLYRKLKALTGLSIHEFIRSIRLKRAAQLLESGSVSVSEAAYQTGFSEMKYFRSYFKSQFGCLPSEYLKTKTPKT